MANRALLPKFRPVTLSGREGAARPAIRPLKLPAPVPPPRKTPSIRPPERRPVLDGRAGVDERAPAPRARVQTGASVRPPEYDPPSEFDETRARPFDEISASRYLHEHVPDHADRAQTSAFVTPYKPLPSPESARSWDRHDALLDPHEHRPNHRLHERPSSIRSEGRRDLDETYRPTSLSEAERYARLASTQYDCTTTPRSGAALPPTEDSGSRERPSRQENVGPTYDGAAYDADYPGAHHEESYPIREESYRSRRHEGRRDGSYRRSLQHEERSSSHGGSRRELPLERKTIGGNGPPSVRAADDYMATSEANPPPQTQTPVMGVPGPIVVPAMLTAGTIAASPRAIQRTPTPPLHASPAPTSYARTVGHQLIPAARHSSKTGRFPWFVFGAAFGLLFAFFAVGVVPHLGTKDEITFPPPPPMTVAAAPTQVVPTLPTATAAPPSLPDPALSPATAFANPAPVIYTPQVMNAPQPVAAQPVVPHPLAPQPVAVQIVAPQQPVATQPIAAQPTAPTWPAAPLPSATPVAPPVEAVAPPPRAQTPAAPRGPRAAIPVRRASPSTTPTPKASTSDNDEALAKANSDSALVDLLSAGLGH